MSTLAITTAQTAGRALVSAGKRYAISYAKRRLRNALDPRVYEGPQLDNFHLLTSRDGAPMARVYGRARLAGQVIWASRLKEHVTEERVGGKGGPKRKDYSYTISFAIGFCEGEILGVDRLWVNGAAFAPSGVTYRVYKGGEDQLPDPIISAVEGPSAPAFRGTAYMVFEDFPLDDYGARLPQINAEIIRQPESAANEPRLEDYVRGVNLLPSSGEYAYATEIVEDVSGPAFPVNLNNLSGQADIEKALDQLETQLPNCKNVSLILSWFGTDLRAGQCQITPGVESADRLTPDQPWQVSGVTRSDAYVVSKDEKGHPNYGGTPSDASIVQAISSLKSRGFKVTIYPFILMDVPPGNGLPDPYGGSEQAAFPWRGRITSSNDMSAAVGSDVDAFFGHCAPADFGVADGYVSYSGPEEFSFRRFILHHAKLAALAGGVDRFIIGSEMRGLTTLRSSAGVYPAVSHFKSLAADVRAVLGAGTGLTYAADWSEYFGHHDGADVTFHLDPLWSDPNIDAVGIDAYFPLSDWRDGEHLDGQSYGAIHDLDYLKSNMEGGEGYDYYYASRADRDAQIRTPITDGAENKPWVYRYKDMRSWWGQLHYNRIGGIEAASPTAWTPQSKPIWLTEVGCPAIDKGANQPNVFVDPKSSESFAPYYSSGSRDDLIQRRYIEAVLTYWQDNNPASSVYNGDMIDMEAAHIWCWDARPFPDFPARRDVWADGNNWQTGHWLSGRTGLVPLRDVVRDIAAQSGLGGFDVSRVNGMIEGYVIDRPMPAAAALEPLAALYQFGVTERAEGISFVSNGAEDRMTLTWDDIIADSPGPIEETKADPDAAPLDVRVHYINASRDYMTGMASARNALSESVRVIDISAPIVMGEGSAKRLAENLLTQASSALAEVNFGLSPARLDVETGDVLILPDREGEWRAALSGDKIAAQRMDIITDPFLSGSFPESTRPVPWTSKPELIILDIPDVSGEGRRSGVLVGAKASPFNPVTVSGPDGSVVLDIPCAAGELMTPLPRGPIGRRDLANVCQIHILDVDLASVIDTDFLGGANQFAVETDSGWEIIQAQNITLIGENTYRCEVLLRALAGTDVDMMETISPGARIVYLNRGLKNLPISSALIGETVTLTGQAAGRESGPAAFTYHARHLRPLAPVHGKASYNGNGDLHLSWIRQTRFGGDNWAGLDVPLGEERELYLVTFWDGEVRKAEFESDTTELVVSNTELQGLGDLGKVSISSGSQAFGFGEALDIAML